MIPAIRPWAALAGITLEGDRKNGHSRRTHLMLIVPVWRAVLATAFLFLWSAGAAEGAEVKGKVVNAQGGEPLAKVQVAIADTGIVATTASDGTFQFSSVAPGSYVLKVSAVGYRTLSVPFQLATAEDRKDFQLTLTPENFSRSDTVEVHSDVFELNEWPSPGELTLTSSELQQTSTVVLGDPFRSLQSLPGVSASGNNDLLAQFSVMGAPFENVGIYVDDVLVPNLIHSIANVGEVPTLSLLTGNDVEELRLMPVAYPVRYGDGSGAALAIRTRDGSDGPPLFHFAAGIAESEFLVEGGFGHNHKGTWLVDARKSYIGYLERALVDSIYSNDGFYDADVKLTYNLNPQHTFSLLATGGTLSIDAPNLSPMDSPFQVKHGTNNLLVARLGWRWTPRSDLLLDSYAALASTRFSETTPANLLLSNSFERDWSGGTNLSWNWRHGAIFQVGYTVRHLDASIAGNNFNFLAPGQPSFFSFGFSDVTQDAYAQQSVQFWHDRVRIAGGLRWARLNTLRSQPITGQSSISLQAARDTLVEFSWGRYAQLPAFVAEAGVFTSGGIVLFRPLPQISSQYLFAVEQRLGERIRFRAEIFDRQNYQREDVLLSPPTTVLLSSRLANRDYSRGIQLTLQRRSENRLSGWIGYTFAHAESKFFVPAIPAPVGAPAFVGPYQPTTQDQRHTANIFASYRLKPGVRVSLKALYGSGFPVSPTFPLRVGPYERLDLRADKSWSLRRFKLNLYTELLNTTNHDNPIFATLGVNGATGQIIVVAEKGLPVTPTAGISVDF